MSFVKKDDTETTTYDNFIDCYVKVVKKQVEEGEKDPKFEKLRKAANDFFE